MSRAVVAVMAGLLCTMAGMKHAASLKADARRLRRWGHILHHLALLLREGTLSIPSALCTAADGAHSPDKLLRDIAAKVQSTPLLTLTEAFRQCGGSCIESELLTRMFTRLGQGSKESRVLAVEQSANEMSLFANAASDKAEKDAKLWQTLGVTGGICLTILLL